MFDPHDAVPDAERRFYEEEFAGATIVASLADLGDAVLDGLGRAAASLAASSHLVVVVPADDRGAVDAVVGATDGRAAVATAPAGPLAPGWVAELWLAVADAGSVVVSAPSAATAPFAAELAVALRAHKLVITDPAGGWGRPPRSFADVVTHGDAYVSQLADRQHGEVVAALDAALAGGVGNVNLCRPDDLDRELFTFDGAGTLFTSGGYLELGALRVDDLPAVERLVAQGEADGLLRPRTRLEVASLAVTGIGARVVGSGHLAGLVALDVDRYRDEGAGEVSCLYTVSRFSGAGAGALLVDGLLARAVQEGVRSVFAVTVSDAAAGFFLRKGFAEVGADGVPAAKWDGYDAERRARARAFSRPVGDEPDQGTLGF
jgi:amino-acid N-acetyltransferase